MASDIPLTTPGSIESVPDKTNESLTVETHVYFEDQERGTQTCGRHCLNNLLQGAYYTDGDLVQFALEMDRAEAALMNATENISHIGRENADASGNYSIQVMNRALGLFECTAKTVSTPDMESVRNNPENQTAFLVHHESHWHAIRKVNDVWYNLNSLPETADLEGASPFRISDFYLSAYLHSLIETNKAIFVVEGEFPTLGRHARHSGDVKGCWYHPDDIPSYGDIQKQIEYARKHPPQRPPNQSASSNGNGLNASAPPLAPANMSLDEQLERAKELSRQESGSYANSQPTASATEMNVDGADDDDDSKMEIEPPTEDGSSLEMKQEVPEERESGIYFETQTYGTMTCGRHCLNNLLQGAYYTDYEFVEFARQMDRAERELMDPHENAYYIGQENADAWGNYSIQVINQALQVFNCNAVAFANPNLIEVQSNPERQDAFLIHKGNHWYAIRKVNGIWYNLNSLPETYGVPAQPYVISEFYLGAYLTQLRQSGMSVFVVFGEFPRMGRSAPHTGDVTGSWYHVGDIKTKGEFEKMTPQKNPAPSRPTMPSASSSAYQNRYTTMHQYGVGAGYRVNRVHQNDLERAKRLSLQESQKPKPALSQSRGTDEELEVALAMSLSMHENGRN